jgi:uncharacterized RDD family membrane protein YckC
VVPARLPLREVRRVRAVRVRLQLRAPVVRPRLRASRQGSGERGATAFSLSRRIRQLQMNAAAREYVGFWPRFGAFVIDSILVLLVTAPVLAWIYRNEPGAGLAELLNYGLADLFGELLRPRGLADVVINWVLPAIAVVAFWLARGATPGKMAFDARVVDAATGGPLSARQGVIRYLGYYVSTIPLFLGLIWVAFDSRKQGWHDKLAGTVVVRSPAAGRPGT